MSVHKKILEKHGYHEIEHQQQQQQSAQEKIKLQLSQLTNSQYIRPTSQVFPNSKSTYFDCKMPFAVVVTPFGPSIEEGFPWVDFGNNIILRCENCRGYLNPYMTFHQKGEDLRCNLCLMQMRIPAYFYQPLSEENNFQRTDYYERADLSQGSYEIKAGQEYSNRPPMAPTYFFMIDVSDHTQGILPILASVLKEAISKYNQRTQIGFLTFDKQIQLYNFDSKLKSAQMVVITDMTTQELPIPGELVFNVFESKDQIFGFLDNLDTMFSRRPQREATQFCNALVISQKIIQYVGGKLIIINGSQIQQLQLNAQQQKQNILTFPSNPIFSSLTPEMHLQSISPSIFIFPNGYMNVITMNDLTRHLNGDLFYYDDINNAHKNFFYDLKNVLEREYAWEAVFRIRPSMGWRIRQTYGNYSIKNNDLLNLTICDQQFILLYRSKSLTYELELLNPTARTDNLYLQSALLYTSKQGERRIRVHNYAIPLSDDINLIYQMADVSTISAVLLKLGLYKLYKTLSPIQTSRFLYLSIKVLYEMGLEKKDDNILQIAQYGIGLMKHAIFNSQYSQSRNTDIINLQRLWFNYMVVDEITPYYLPSLFKIDDIAPNECIIDNNGYFIFPQQVTLSLESIQSGGMYLMDCGNVIYIYISKYKIIIKQLTQQIIVLRYIWKSLLIIEFIGGQFIFQLCQSHQQLVACPHF